MRTIFLFLLFLLSYFTSGQTTIWSENFDGMWTTIAPAGMTGAANPSYETWNRNDYTSNWYSPNSGSPTSTGAQATSYYARYHSFDIFSGNSSQMTKAIDLSSYSTSVVTLQFYYINPDGSDQLRVRLSSDNGTNYTSVSTLNVASSWTLYSITIPSAYLVSGFKLRFVGVSDFGNTDIGLDQISIVTALNPPTSISISETSGLANNDGTICSGVGTTLTANGAIGTVYWYTNSCGGTQIGTGNTITVAPTTTTTYYARNNNGGWSTCVNTTINVNPAPANVNAGNDVSICSGASTQLNGSVSSVVLCTNTSTLSNTTNYNVPDNNAIGGSSIINVSSSCGTAAEIVSVKVNINHLWVEDLDISLIAPNGSTINLSSDNGASGVDYINTVFTASGLMPITLGTAPFTGNYIPEEPFTNFTGSAVGNWTLKVVDDEYLLGGTIINWSIVVKTNQNVIVTYSWSPTTGLDNPNIINPIASPTTTTTYTMTATANGCSASDSVIVSLYPVLNAGVHNSTPLTQCVGYNPAELTFTTNPTGGNGNYTYQWQLNTVDILNATSNTYDPNPILVAGVYAYRCKVTAGCGNSVYTAPKIITIVADPNEPSCLKSPNLPSVCVGTSLTLQNCIYGTESGVLCPLEYSYSIDAGVNWSATSTIVPNFSATGTTNLIRARVSNCGSCNTSSWMVYSWNIYPTPSTTNINHN